MTIDRFRTARDVVSGDADQLHADVGDVKPCRVLVFTSPKAGSGAGREQVSRLIRLFEDSNVEYAVVQTPDELKSQLKSTAQTQDAIVVAAGGDGTVSLAAASLADARTGDSGPADRAAIVPMPLGTENLLARQFGHSAIAESVFNTIRHGSSYRMDAGIANGKTFLIMATCGFDAEVVRGMHLTRRGHINRLSYTGPIVRAMRKYKFPKIEIRIDDSETIECCWAMVFNLPRYAAGLGIEPDAIGDDGQLDVIAFRGGSIPLGMRYLAGIWLRRHLKFQDVIRRRGKEIKITSESRVPFQLDGDYAGKLPLRVITSPGHVHLLVPPGN